MDGGKGRPTLRLHATKEKMENAQYLLQLAMHRYFGGRAVTLIYPCHPRVTRTKEWEYLLGYTLEAHTVPKSDIEAVINVYDFKFVDGPDGVSIEAEANCTAAGWRPNTVTAIFTRQQPTSSPRSKTGPGGMSPSPASHSPQVHRPRRTPRS